MKIAEIALLVQGRVEGDGNTDVSGLGGLETVKPGDLVFASDEDKLAIAEKTPASCVLTTMDMRKSVKPLLRVSNPKLAFLMMYNAMNKPVVKKAFTDPSATVAASASVGKNVWIDAGARIGEDVRIGDNTVIESNVVIKKGCAIGSFCYIHPNVTLYENTVLKDRVILHSGVVLGADGFGYVRDKDKLYKFPQLGRVVIEDNVEIGANAAIDRGSLNDTVIGAGTKIDNLCQIAHNVKIGRNVIMAALCGIAGSVTIKDNATLGGQAGFKDNVVVGRNSVVAAQSGVLKDVPDGAIVWGTPADAIVRICRQTLVLGWLTDNFAKIKKLVGSK